MGRWIVMFAIVGTAACGGGHVGDAIDAAAHDGSSIDGPPGADCAALDLDTCRHTSGCTPDYCSDCTCNQSFEGCRAVADTPFDCPPLICPEPSCCGGDGDCDPVGETCLHPGESPGCAVPNNDPGDCTSDPECDQAGGEICELIPCSEIGAMHCIPGCTGPGDCPTGTECNPEHRCTSQPCDDSSPCPSDFHCDESFCARDSCDDDLDCTGFCVDGLCYEGLGTCSPQPA